MSVILENLDTIQHLKLNFQYALKLDKSLYYIENSILKRIVSKDHQYQKEDSNVILENVQQICSDGKLLYCLRNGDLFQIEGGVSKVIVQGKNLQWIGNGCSIDVSGKGFVGNKQIYTHCKHISVYDDKFVLITLGGKFLVGPKQETLPQINGLKINGYFKKSLLFSFGGIALTESGDVYCFNKKMIRLRVPNLSDIGCSSQYIFGLADKTIIQFKIEDFQNHQFYSNTNIFQKLNTGNEIQINFKKQQFREIKFMCFEGLQFIFGNLQEVSYQTEQSVSVLDKTFTRDNVNIMKQQLQDIWDQGKKKQQKNQFNISKFDENDQSKIRQSRESNRKQLESKEEIKRQKTQEDEQPSSRRRTEEARQSISRKSIEKENRAVETTKSDPKEFKLPLEQITNKIDAKQAQESRDTPRDGKETVQMKLAKIREKLNMEPLPHDDEQSYSLYTLAEENSAEHSFCEDKQEASKIYNIQRKKYLVNDVFDQKHETQGLSKKIESIKEKVLGEQQLNQQVKPIEIKTELKPSTLEKILGKISFNERGPSNHEQSQESLPTFQNDEQFLKQDSNRRQLKSFLKVEPKTQQQSKKALQIENSNSELQSAIDFQNVSGFVDNYHDSFIRLWNEQDKIDMPLQLPSRIAQRAESKDLLSTNKQVKSPTQSANITLIPSNLPSPFKNDSKANSAIKIDPQTIQNLENLVERITEKKLKQKEDQKTEIEQFQIDIDIQQIQQIQLTEQTENYHISSMKLNQMPTIDTVEYTTIVSTDRQSLRLPPDPIIIKRSPKKVPSVSRSLVPPLVSVRNGSQRIRTKSPTIMQVSSTCNPYQRVVDFNKKNQQTQIRKLFFRLDMKFKLLKLESMFNLKQYLKK
ncbi:hypothetical protein pb186bvf_008139 [Paramecium bursaria]